MRRFLFLLISTIFLSSCSSSNKSSVNVENLPIIPTEQYEYEDGDKLTKHDAGCNGSYSLYSANDVTMFLSSMFPIIDKLLEQPSESKCYRWVGNTNIAMEKGVNLVLSLGLSKNTLQELPV